MIARLIQVAWETGAVALIVGTILTVRKARARSKRLFVDLPAKRLGPPPARKPHVDHRWDAMN